MLIFLYGIPIFVLSETLFLGSYVFIKTNKKLQAKKEYYKLCRESIIENKDTLKEYESDVKKYCREIKTKNLTDIQIIIKLMRDISNNIRYDGNQKNISGLNRLVLYKEKKGCCIHIADDMTAKLNYINPKFNARTMYVKMLHNKNSGYRLPFRVPIESIYVEDNNEENTYEKEDKKAPNHAICAIDIPDKNITLVIDPTNPSIGYMKGKKIKLFGGNNIEYTYSIRYNYVMCKSKLLSFLLMRLTDDIRFFSKTAKIEKLYGIEVQKEALESIKFIDSDYSIEKSNKMLYKA